jgi:anhydro-N-acetylmuramic acid kinase
MALYIGLMSGTSLDGVDGILVSIPDDYSGGKLEILADANVPFERSFRKQLMQLQSADINEIELEGEVANTLAHKYAENIKILLDKAALSPKDVTAAGIHGQTIRHRPE